MYVTTTMTSLLITLMTSVYKLFIDIDGNSAHFRCRDHRTYPLDERRQCLCSELHPIVIGRWSDCIVEKGNGGGLSPSNDQKDDNSCGAGKRYKVVTCRNNGNAIQSANRCAVNGKFVSYSFQGSVVIGKGRGWGRGKYQWAGPLLILGLWPSGWGKPNCFSMCLLVGWQTLGLLANVEVSS